MISPKNIFCCYAHKDQQYLLELKNHLSPLQRQGLIKITADIDISPGENWENEISNHLNTSQIILLLVSPEFIASSYCYTKEMEQALKRHKQGDVCVIPIIVRSVYWKETPLGELQALPKGAKPIKDWPNRDRAYLNIVEEIRLIVEKLSVPKSTSTQSTIAPPASQQASLPISSSLKSSPILPVNVPTSNQKPAFLLPSLPSNQKSSFSSFHPIKNPLIQPANMPLPDQKPSLTPNISNDQQTSFSALNQEKRFPTDVTFPNQQQSAPMSNPPMNRQAPLSVTNISTIQPSTFPMSNPPMNQQAPLSVPNTLVNQLSFPPSNSSINQPPIWFAPSSSKSVAAKRINSSRAFKNVTFIMFKITLYLIGAFFAEFGFSGGVMYSIEPNQNLANTMVTIAFIMGLVVLTISIIIFFKKRYYRHRLSGKKYALLTIGATIGLLIGGVLITTLLPGPSTVPPQGPTLGIVLFLYGLFLIVVVHLKSLNLPSRKI